MYIQLYGYLKPSVLKMDTLEILYPGHAVPVSISEVNFFFQNKMLANLILTFFSFLSMVINLFLIDSFNIYLCC
jgi:hypothetical protein